MAKRGNGEGHYSKLPSGSWRCQIMDGYKDNGKPRMRSFTGATKVEVQQKVREFLFNRPEEITEKKEYSFEDWARIWYQGYKTQVQPSTYCNYQYTLNTLISGFSAKKLSEIKQIDINRFMDRLLEEGCSNSKVSKCKAMLVQIFTSAEENELITRNPALHANVIRTPEGFGEEEKESKKDAFTEEEVSSILQSIPNNLIGNSIGALLGTGLRTQELLALTKADIAEDGSTVTVNKAIKMVKGQPVLGPPKSKRSRRTIPVPEEYRGYVLFLREHGGSQYIWTSSREDGLYATKVFRNHYFKVLAEIPGVRQLTPHCCRHTYITRLQALGVPMEIIARLVGHSNIAVTDGYTHTSIDTLDKAVAVFNTGKEKTK